MQDDLIFFQRLKKIQSEQTFEQLEHFHDPKIWTQMSENERQLLSQLFLKHAEQIIFQGDPKTFVLFELAEKIGSPNASLYFQQGEILLNYALVTQQPQYYMLAKHKFEQASPLDPNNWLLYHQYAVCLTRVAASSQDYAMFEEAHQAFAKVKSLIPQENEKLSRFYWELGRSWYFLGKISGEAIDYKNAIDSYQEALSYGAESVAFWNDYGVALIHIAPLISSADALIKAIDFFALALKEDPASAVSWFHLGCAFQQLYSILGQEDLFVKADEYFKMASELNSDHVDTWYQWGVLLLLSGKYSKNIRHLSEAVEKFSIACESKSDFILGQCGWTEALTLLGAFGDNLSFLKQAKEKILKMIEIEPEKPDIWCCYGRCLNEFGRYYSDQGYFEEAIIKFQQGLAFDNGHAFIWQGIAESYLSLGEIRSDEHLLEKAAHYFSRAVRFKSSLPNFWFEWGISLLKLGELTEKTHYIEDSIEKFERAIRLRGGLEGSAELEWLYYLGCAYDQLGDLKEDQESFKKAVALLNHVLEKDPEYSFARYNLAVALTHLGELTYEIDYFKLAIDHFRILCEEDGEDEVVLSDWGLTLLNMAYLIYDTNQPENNLQILAEAENKLLQAVSLGSAQAYYHLACFYSLTEQPDASIFYLQKAEAHQALPPLDDLLHDEWLESVRNTETFKRLISKLKRES